MHVYSRYVLILLTSKMYTILLILMDTSYLPSDYGATGAQVVVHPVPEGVEGQPLVFNL